MGAWIPGRGFSSAARWMLLVAQGHQWQTTISVAVSAALRWRRPRLMSRRSGGHCGMVVPPFRWRRPRLLSRRSGGHCGMVVPPFRWRRPRLLSRRRSGGHCGMVVPPFRWPWHGPRLTCSRSRCHLGTLVRGVSFSIYVISQKHPLETTVSWMFNPASCRGRCWRAFGPDVHQALRDGRGGLSSTGASLCLCVCLCVHPYVCVSVCFCVCL